MKINFCEFCEHHEVFVDKINDECYHDGCVCALVKPESEQLHIINCTEYTYVGSDLRSGCPNFEIRNDLLTRRR